MARQTLALYRRYLHSDFPNIKTEHFRQTSTITDDYNCIAWACGDNSKNYWPIGGYWPNGIPRDESIDSFKMLFMSKGYKVCDNGDYELGCQKIAIFTKDSIPTHAARQLNNGYWTSKLGISIDVEHSLNALCGRKYGKVELFMKREISKELEIID